MLFRSPKTNFESLIASGVIQPLIREYIPKPLPPELSIGFMSLSVLTNNVATYIEDQRTEIFAISSVIASPSKIFSTETRGYKIDNFEHTSFNEDFCHDKQRLCVQNLVNLLDSSEKWPIIGFEVDQALACILKELLFLSKDESLVSIYKNRLFSMPGSKIDLGRLLYKLEPKSYFKGELGRVKVALDLSTTYSFIPVSKCFTNYELCNYLLNLGFSSGAFKDFDSLIAFEAKPILLPECPIGKVHRGKAWADVPKSFVGWLLKQDWVRDYKSRDLLYTLGNLEQAIALGNELNKKQHNAYIIGDI